MNNFLQQIYNELATEHINFTERDFSIEYLGKCGSYFAHLKSADKEPSADALLTLFAILSKQRYLYEQNLPIAKSSTQRQILNDWIALYSKLQGDVFVVLKRYNHNFVEHI